MLLLSKYHQEYLIGELELGDFDKILVLLGSFFLFLTQFSCLISELRKLGILTETWARKLSKLRNYPKEVEKDSHFACISFKGVTYYYDLSTGKL